MLLSKDSLQRPQDKEIQALPPHAKKGKGGTTFGKLDKKIIVEDPLKFKIGRRRICQRSGASIVMPLDTIPSSIFKRKGSKNRMHQQPMLMMMMTINLKRIQRNLSFMRLLMDFIKNASFGIH